MTSSQRSIPLFNTSFILFIGGFICFIGIGHLSDGFSLLSSIRFRLIQLLTGLTRRGCVP